MAAADVMSPLELPPVPQWVSLQDVEFVRDLRQRHEEELRAYEEETRRQRHKLRKLKKDMMNTKSAEPLEEEPQQVPEPAADKDAEAEAAKKLLQEQEAEADRLQEAAFNVERARLDEELRQAKVDTERAEPHGTSSAGASAASSAAQSRSSSPTGSETVVVAVPAGKGVSKLPVAEVVASSTPSNDCTSQMPTPRKGAGKGKSKGNAPPPPPSGMTPRQSMEQARPTKPSKFVNLYWKATQKPENVDEQLLANDPFQAKIRDPNRRDVSSDQAAPSPVLDITVPPRPATIFEPGVDLKIGDLPEEMLEHFFKRCEAAVKLPQIDSTQQNHERKPAKCFLDPKRLNMLGIMLQRHLMEHKEESAREAILNIKRAVLQCCFDVVKLEGLSIIRTVLRQHVKDGSPLCVYVKTHGDAAIWQLENPEHQYLVYELTKVPQIDERLECMLFQLGFDENMATCRQNLETLQKALEALKAKRELISRFFVTAHRLGQSLSQKPSRGFQLSTLEKLTQTKSTKMPHLSILHFVLALMSREDAQELFSEQDIVLLRNAKSLNTAKVCDECRELAQGLYGVKQIYESGEYTSQQSGQAVKIERRRKTLPPSAAAAALKQEPVIDTDDHFHEVMQNFVDLHLDEADDIVVECHKMVLLYKELALFFDDLNSVYPPPKEPTDKKFDLVDVFYRFAVVVPQHRQQVEDECLRESIAMSGF